MEGKVAEFATTQFISELLINIFYFLINFTNIFLPFFVQKLTAD